PPGACGRSWSRARLAVMSISRGGPGLAPPAWLAAAARDERSQLPATGVQLPSPYTKGATVGAPGVLLLRRYQVPVPGSTVPMVAGRLRPRRPTRGFQPAPPYWNGAASGPPGVLLLRRYQVAVDGSTTPTVAVPLPSQSPATGTQPGAPYGNG